MAARGSGPEGVRAEQRRPVRARITGTGSGTELMKRLTRQALEGANDEILELLAQHRPPQIADRLTVTWHLRSCPHYAADRVLAGEED